jgi:hypothetical protein
MTGVRRLIDVVEFVGFFAYLALVFAELRPLDRPVPTDSLSMYAVPATMWGARVAYDHRRSGRMIMLSWGVAAALGLVVLWEGLIVVTQWITPSVRAQAWLPPLLIGLAIAVILVAVGRRTRRESTVEGRKIALAETFGLGLVPIGLWLATQGESLLPIGAVLAIAGPLILIWLQGQRRKRQLAIGPGRRGASPDPNAAS